MLEDLDSGAFVYIGCEVAGDRSPVRGVRWVSEEGSRVGEVAIVEVEVLRVEAGDALRVERARATDDAVHRI